METDVWQEPDGIGGEHVSPVNTTEEQAINMVLQARALTSDEFVVLSCVFCPLMAQD